MPCAPASGRCATMSSSRSARACCGCGRGRPRTSSRWPAVGRARTTPAGVSWRPRCSARCRTSTGPGSAGAAWRHRRRPPSTKHRRAEEQQDLAQRLRRVPEVTEALDRMWPRLSPHEFLHDLLGARPLLPPRGRESSAAQRCSASTGPAARRSTRCRGPSPTRRSSTRPAPCSAPAGPSGPDGPGHEATRSALAPETGFWPQGLAASPAPVVSPGTGADDEIRSFGHIVVDEVQDLSPDAAAHAGPSIAVRLHDRGGRHRAGHRALGARRAGTTSRAI